MRGRTSLRADIQGAQAPEDRTVGYGEIGAEMQVTRGRKQVPTENIIFFAKEQVCGHAVRPSSSFRIAVFTLLPTLLKVHFSF